MKTIQTTDETARIGLLTAQERECLRLVARQLSSKEIAAELRISKASVDTYCNRARAKLGVASRREAAQLIRGIEAGAIRPPAEEPPPQPPAEPPVSRAVLLPPIASLGPLERCWAIVGGAAALTLGFGMLLSGLQSLDSVVGAAQARAQNAQLQATPGR